MDLLTQLQDKLDHLFLVFGTCIGVLQRDAPASSFDEKLNQQPLEWQTQTKDMALQVIETSKLIESIIDSLPGFNRTEPEQYERLKTMNEESQDLNNHLNQTIEESEGHDNVGLEVNIDQS
eukprot:gene11926-13894_t